MAASVMADREPVGLGVYVHQKVAHRTRQVLEVVHLGIQRRVEMVGLMTVIFCEGDYGDIQAMPGKRFDGGIELGSRTVYEYQVGERPFGMLQAAIKYFGQHRGIPATVDAHIEQSVLRPLSVAIHEHNHGAGPMLALDVRNVVALNAAGFIDKRK